MTKQRVRYTAGEISPVRPRDNPCFDIEVERDFLRDRVALLERALEKAAAALTMAYMARTADEQQMTAEAREYVLFTVMPETGVGVMGKVWDAD